MMECLDHGCTDQAMLRWIVRRASHRLSEAWLGLVLPNHTLDLARLYDSSNGYQWTLLVILAFLKKGTACELLLRGHRDVNPSAVNQLALRNAAIRGFGGTVALLLADPHVDPTVLNCLALTHALNSGHADVARLLVADDRVAASVRRDVPPSIAARLAEAGVALPEQ